ncbi:MAG: double zinc ribbon domain-containing protein, partial [Actinomycetota bacterium]
MGLCPNCGAGNRPEARFCGSCGTALSLSCPNGHAVPPGFSFCDTCGAALAQPAPGSAQATDTIRIDVAATERRLVSVLFADLVGFTTISESRDPEEVRDILSRYFETSRALVERYGGVVEKFIGDAVMAVWGAPAANEDDPE